MCQLFFCAVGGTAGENPALSGESLCDHHIDSSDSGRFTVLYDEQRRTKALGGEPNLWLGTYHVRARTGSGNLSHVGAA